MAQGKKRGERRFPPRVYKLVLAAHIIFSVGLLGVLLAKVVLGVAATASGDSELSGSLYLAMGVVNTTFAPAVMGAFATGVLLSLGTKWGLLRHYWVATKLALTVAVIMTGAALVDGLTRQSVAAASGSAAGGGEIMGMTLATLLISLSAAHMLTLGVATVVAVYKPWGKTPLGRRRAVRSPSGKGTR